MCPRVGAALLITTIGAAGCSSPPARPDAPSDNLAGGRPVTALGSRGDPAVLTDGRLATEGTFPGGMTLALDDVHSAGVVDLGDLRVVRALLLQASTSDVYFVEASTDGSGWTVVWRVPRIEGAVALRTRTTVRPRGVLARWLRVRTSSARSAGVSELQAFETAAPPWPPLDTRPPGSALPLWPTVTPERLATVYEALAALLMLVVGWSALARRWSPRAAEEHVRRAALAVVALASLVAWPYLFNFHYPRFVHTGEVFHYYMGGKYLPELGYTRLYACTVVVDAEDGIELGDQLVRDLRDNRRVPAVRELARAAECRARFTPERWEAFRHDTRFFRAALGERRWFRVRNDHGFNATPAWAVPGGLLAGLAPASWAQVVPLTLLDLVLVLAMFLLFGRAFGFEAACLAAGYFGLNYLSQFGWTGGAFLRYDWLFWLVAGVAALRTRRPAVAGFALASSTLIRVFPVFAILGLGLKAAVEAVEERSVRPLVRQRRFAAGAVAAGLVFVAASAVQTGRIGLWAEFADNSAKHLATESVNFVGLPVFLAYEHEARLELMTDPRLEDPVAEWVARVSATAERMRAAQWAAAVAFVLLLALGVRRAPDWEAAVLGLGLMPMLLKLSGYYYSGFVVYAALWPASAGSGLALAAFTWASNVIPRLWPGADERYAWLSLAAVVLAAGVTLGHAWRGRGNGGIGDAPDPREGEDPAREAPPEAVRPAD